MGILIRPYPIIVASSTYFTITEAILNQFALYQPIDHIDGASTENWELQPIADLTELDESIINFPRKGCYRTKGGQYNPG